MVASLKIEQLSTDLIGPISFEVRAGECTALVGASGAGKSLLLRAIVDLDPNSGQVAFGNHRRRSMPASAWRKMVALVPAESGWWADGVGTHFPPNGTAEPVLEALGLAGCLDWEIARLSTGERQRLAFARALAFRPRVLLLDEPTASLDETATERVETIIRQCCADQMPVLLVTHDAKQARRLATQHIHLSGGKIENIEHGREQ